MDELPGFAEASRETVSETFGYPTGLRLTFSACFAFYLLMLAFSRGWSRQSQASARK